MCEKVEDLTADLERVQGELGYHRKKHFEFRDLWQNLEAPNKMMTDMLAETLPYIRASMTDEAQGCSPASDLIEDILVITATTLKDNCEICKGSKGGVRGNENIVDGKVMCDYCTSDHMKNAAQGQGEGFKMPEGCTCTWSGLHWLGHETCPIHKPADHQGGKG